MEDAQYMQVLHPARLYLNLSKNDGDFVIKSFLKNEVKILLSLNRKYSARVSRTRYWYDTVIPVVPSLVHRYQYPYWYVS